MHSKMFRLLALGLAAFVAGCSNPASSDSSPAPAPVVDSNFGIFSDAHAAAAEFTTSTGKDAGSVTVATVSDGSFSPFSGSKLLTVDYQQTSWGGFYFGLTTPITAASFANGELVFTVDASRLSGLTSLTVKVASATYPSEVGGTLDLFKLNPSATSGNWKTYKVPLKSFTSYGLGLPDFTKLTTYFGLWNPMAGSSAANGKLLLDEVYYAPSIDLTVQGLSAAASNVNLTPSATSSPKVSLSYTNGTSVALANSSLTWTSDAPATATVGSDGTITGKATGATTIHGTYGGKTVDIAVTVAASLSPLGVYSETNAVSGSPSLTSNTAQGWGGATMTFDGASTDVASDGTHSIKMTSAGASWGGVLFQYASGGLDVSQYTKLVFSLNRSGLAAMTDLGIKIETDGNGTASTQIQLSTLTATSTSNGWETFEIPLSSYTNVTLSKINNLGFWNMQDSSATMIAGTIYLDNVYFKP